VIKLKRVTAACKLRPLAAAILAVLLAGCPSAPRQPAPAPAPSAPSAPAVEREGRPFAISGAESLLAVLVYRGGALARVGHNHVVASHNLSGMAWVAEDITRSSFDVRVPVNDLVIDETQLRVQEGADFPPEVPESAKQGTRTNMLGAALLDGATYPEVRLQSESIEKTAEGLRAQVRVSVRDQTRSLVVPLTYELANDELRVQGQVGLKQTDLGLTPFSALGGAMRVQDEIEVRFRLLARPAPAP
jgi:polyisoprenoid-binding protein YceI